jgi:alpha-glucosidase
VAKGIPEVSELLWWQRGIVYQVYPRSFQDDSGDGIGDLAGIARRLDYLKWLGVDAVWLSPIFRSPMVDHGYDVSDYCDIDPSFGTLADFDGLLARAHALDLKLILDFVPNHTSDQHAWFRQSRASRQDPKRQWYLWRDPAPGGGAPNNWLSNFGGSAWEWDAQTGQYYYHAFHKAQPDVNWRNPEVRKAMYDVMRFWFDRGVDGFRIDVLWHFIKDALLRDNPSNPDWRPGMPPHKALLQKFSTDQPEMAEIIRELRQVADRYPERVLIGEIYLPVERLVAYYGQNGDGVHLPFNFQLVTLPWDARAIADAIARYERVLADDAWPNWVLGNHDQPRLATRIGLDQARVAAMLLLTLRGTPTIYYGEEIGMHDVEVPTTMRQDPQGRGMPGTGMERDFYRTPMQWSAGEKSGFSESAPWLPLADDAIHVNVEAQREEPTSLLRLYRSLIRLRRAEPVLVEGRYTALPAGGDTLAYFRETEEARLLVALNLGHAPASVACPGIRGSVVLGTAPGREAARIAETISLAPDEGVIVRVEA